MYVRIEQRTQYYLPNKKINMEKKSPGLFNKTPKKIREEQKINAKQYMNYTNFQLDDRLLRIKKIKESNENFKRELQILQ